MQDRASEWVSVWKPKWGFQDLVTRCTLQHPSTGPDNMGKKSLPIIAGLILLWYDIINPSQVAKV